MAGRKYRPPSSPARDRWPVSPDLVETDQGGRARQPLHQLDADVAGLISGKISVLARPATGDPGAFDLPTASTSAASACNSPSTRRSGARSRTIRNASTTLSTHLCCALPLVENDSSATRGSAPMTLRVVAAVAMAISARSTADGSITTPQSANARIPSCPNARFGRATMNALETMWTSAPFPLPAAPLAPFRRWCLPRRRRSHPHRRPPPSAPRCKAVGRDFGGFHLGNAFGAPPFEIQTRVLPRVLFGRRTILLSRIGVTRPSRRRRSAAACTRASSPSGNTMRRFGSSTGEAVRFAQRETRRQIRGVPSRSHDTGGVAAAGLLSRCDDTARPRDCVRRSISRTGVRPEPSALATKYR